MIASFKPWLASLCLLLLAHITFAADTDDAAAKRARLQALKQLPIQQLSKIEFYNPDAQLASRKSRALIENPSALFVLTGKEIQRAGITSLPEALRLVPGVQVARLYSNRWAISARGLNGYISSKLLVMVDGRTVYTPLRSEVFWDAQDMLVEDIDRIEVIRGPGASLWGANAVNGIINIVSKKARQTQGGLATLLLGNGDENAILGLRYGGQFNSKTHYRVYGKAVDYDSLQTAQGESGGNDWNTRRMGFRVDGAPDKHNEWTLQGDTYNNQLQQVRRLLNDENRFVLVDNALNVQGANVLGRWQQALKRGEWIVQSYYDWTQRSDRLFDETRHTFDLDFQHRIPLSLRQEYLWGAGVRHSRDDIQTPSRMLSYSTDQREDWLFSAFVQGEFVLSPKRWRLLLGSKFEHNSYTGFEYQPSVRLLWSPHEQHRLWAAVSRAVRTPSRTDHDGFIETSVFNAAINAPIIFRVNGSPDYVSETLLAYEFGYRYLPSRQFLLDATVFMHELENLRTVEPLGLDLTQRPPFLLTQIDNQLYGEVLGAELSLHWQPLRSWRLTANYTYTAVYLHLQPGSRSVFAENEEGDHPKHQFSLRSQWDLTRTVQFDHVFYYVGKVEGQATPDYLRWDVHLGWQVQRRLQLNLGLRNALNQRHPEFGNVVDGNTEIPGEVPRSAYLQLRYNF